MTCQNCLTDVDEFEIVEVKGYRVCLYCEKQSYLPPPMRNKETR